MAAPASPGYGASLINELIPYELGSWADLSFADDGMCCRIEIPGKWIGKGEFILIDLQGQVSDLSKLLGTEPTQSQNPN